MPNDVSLYDADFYAWIAVQARAVRAVAAGGNMPIDWENLAEEIEALGRCERREVTSRLSTLIEHLLKLAVSPATAPRRGWRETIRRTRREIEMVLADSPSLRPELPTMIVEMVPGMAAIVANALSENDEATAQVLERLNAITFTPEQVFGDWLPDPAA